MYWYIRSIRWYSSVIIKSISIGILFTFSFLCIGSDVFANFDVLSIARLLPGPWWSFQWYWFWGSHIFRQPFGVDVVVGLGGEWILSKKNGTLIWYRKVFFGNGKCFNAVHLIVFQPDKAIGVNHTWQGHMTVTINI